VDATESGQDSKIGFCGHGNETSDSVKGEEFLYRLSYWLMSFPQEDLDS
jgi:hypothetical protein